MTCREQAGKQYAQPAIFLIANPACANIFHYSQRVNDVARVLIVDDFEPVRRVLTTMLGPHPGVEVVGEAADGEQAVRRVEELAPDVVIMDVRMPVMGGIEATRRIKSEWPSVIVVGHSSDPSTQSDMDAAGADAHVPKGAPREIVLDLLLDLTK